MKLDSPLWRQALIIGLVSVFVVGAAGLSKAQPVEGGDEDSSDPVRLSWSKQPDVQSCDLCHYEPRGGISTSDVSFSRQNELKFWLANDKHAIARRRVEPLTKDELVAEAEQLLAEYQLSGIPADWFGESNPLSRRICDKLGYDVKSPEGYAMFRDNCLTCHGGYRGASDDKFFAHDEFAQPGISCNYCHQIGENRAWADAHGNPSAIANADTWRNKSGAEKSSAGMRDLVNVATQAGTCYDCHVGNLDKKMFVSHVMYAAGHPPLPGIELQTFCASMPQHWQEEIGSLQVVGKCQSGSGDKYFHTNFPALKTGSVFWNTRKMLIGALAARLQSVDLLIVASAPESEQWADYSLYDCAACHHELREPSVRQARGYVGAPGRPRQLEWPEAILNVALEVAGTKVKDTVQASEKKLAMAYAKTPFGDAAEVNVLASDLKKNLESAIKQTQERPIDANVSRKILRRLAETPKGTLLVYDSARQVVWAMQAIDAELRAAGEPLPPALTEKIAALGEPAVTGIEATLPAGRQVFIYSANLNAELKRKSAYTPGDLAARLAEIAKDIQAEIKAEPANPTVAAR